MRTSFYLASLAVVLLFYSMAHGMKFLSSIEVKVPDYIVKNGAYRMCYGDKVTVYDAKKTIAEYFPTISVEDQSLYALYNTWYSFSERRSEPLKDDHYIKSVVRDYNAHALDLVVLDELREIVIEQST